MSILENIHGHKDLVDLTAAQREVLCQEIRDFLIDSVSKTGGHVSSNLGVVELTVAIETVFDTEVDRLVFDVGHQSYIHKLLSGRQADFSTLRQFGGMAGFPKPNESNADAFVAGHASSSVSIALGMARARSMQKQDYRVVALIGDGAATGGMAYEALNDAAVSDEPMIVILNDNAMSIDHNVGGLAKHLSRLRTKEKYMGMKQRYRNVMYKLPGGRAVYHFTRRIKDAVKRMLLPATLFESMGLSYLGPVDGHDTENLITLLHTAVDMNCPVVLHVTTQKGRGYEPAREHPKLFHGIGKFDPVTGEPLKKSIPTFSDAFGQELVRLAGENPAICAITAAMPGGTGLLDYKKQFPNRLFDVGIAEEHAVSMAGGLAKQGMIPVVALYSTFLQRAYDMILQDICMLKLHVILAVDRAGLVGEDGETHHGVFDVGFLRQAPNLTVLCPGSRKELQAMLRWAVEEQSGPVAIRYPRGGDKTYQDSAWYGDPQINGVCCHRNGEDITLITYGTMLDNAMAAAELLEKHGIHATVLRLLCVAPIPFDQILANLSVSHKVLVIEDSCSGSGIREAMAYELCRRLPDCVVAGADLGLRYIPHGSVEQLHLHCGLDPEAIAKYAMEVCQSEN